MSRMAVVCLAGLLAGCAGDPYGPGTVRVVLPDGERFVGKYMPLTSVAFPPGPPIVYGMGPAGAVTRQQALLVGRQGEVIVCRFSGGDTGVEEVVCQTPDGRLEQGAVEPNS